MSEKKKSSEQIKLMNITLFFIGLFALLILNVFRVQIIMGGYWKKVADRQYSRGGEVVGERGKIISRNGEELAYNIPEYEIDVDPMAMIKIPEVSKILAKNLGLDSNKLAGNIEILKRKKKRYMKVAEHVPLEIKTQIEKDLKALHKRAETGIFFYNLPKRFYPKERFMASVLGYTNFDGKGAFGVEKSYDGFLKGERGYEKRYVSTYMIFDMPVDKKREKIEAENGKNVILTIDSVMQYILEDELKKCFEINAPEWAVGIIVEPNTGKILAMSSIPIESNSLLKNKAISNSYEPGSVIKPIIMGMAINENITNEHERFYSKGYIELFNRKIKDHDDSAVGSIDAKEAIAKSSNVVMAQLGMRFDKNRFYDYFRQFGFGEKSGISLPGEVRGILKPVKKWDGLTAATSAFGQGISATPIQMAMAMAATINGGNLYTPIIVDSIVDDKGNIVYESKPELRRSVISPATSEKIKEMMRETVVNGTGKAASIEGYDIGGKTGTSQKVVNGQYMRGHYVASFAGFYPIDNPQYLCLVIVDNPSKGNYYGGSIAAPVFHNTMQRIIKYKNILPYDINTRTIYVTSGNAVKVIEPERALPQATDVMPDLKGITLREVLEFMNNFPEAEVTVEGKGMVILQSPSAGTPMEGVKRVHVILGEVRKKTGEEKPAEKQ